MRGPGDVSRRTRYMLYPVRKQTRHPRFATLLFPSSRCRGFLLFFLSDPTLLFVFAVVLRVFPRNAPRASLPFPLIPAGSRLCSASGRARRPTPSPPFEKAPFVSRSLLSCVSAPSCMPPPKYLLPTITSPRTIVHAPPMHSCSIAPLLPSSHSQCRLVV